MFCTTNTTTNANEIKALTRVESEVSEFKIWLQCLHSHCRVRNDYSHTQFSKISNIILFKFIIIFYTFQKENKLSFVSIVVDYADMMFS